MKEPKEGADTGRGLRGRGVVWGRAEWGLEGGGGSEGGQEAGRSLGGRQEPAEGRGLRREGRRLVWHRLPGRQTRGRVYRGAPRGQQGRQTVRGRALVREGGGRELHPAAGEGDVAQPAAVLEDAVGAVAPLASLVIEPGKKTYLWRLIGPRREVCYQRDYPV